jgi:hypothetical protein
VGGLRRPRGASVLDGEHYSSEHAQILAQCQGGGPWGKR